MRTPAGKECRYFYGDYFRGRSLEECRLLKDAGVEWQPRHCNTCPVPEVLLANACENLRFKPTLKRPLLILPAHVQVTASCTKCNCAVAQPHIGCGQCHALPFSFEIAPDETDPAL